MVSPDSFIPVGPFPFSVFKQPNVIRVVIFGYFPATFAKKNDLFVFLVI